MTVSTVSNVKGFKDREVELISEKKLRKKKKRC